MIQTIPFKYIQMPVYYNTGGSPEPPGPGPGPDYSKIPITFESVVDGAKVNWNKYGNAPVKIIFYKLGDDGPWQQYTNGTDINLNTGDKVSFSGAAGWDSSFTPNSSNRYSFGGSGVSGSVKVYGNIASIFNWNETLYSKQYLNTFISDEVLYDATDLYLPSANLAYACYEYLFYNAHFLQYSPKALLATTLADECYAYMFNNCSSLLTAPQLPATTVSAYCYMGMFQGCKSLTGMVELPATTMAQGCYNYMFYDCTNLASCNMSAATNTDALSTAYQYMFANCSNLVHLDICFTNWLSAWNSSGRRWDFSTKNWLPTTGTGRKIYCPAALPAGDGTANTIPNNWTRINK